MPDDPANDISSQQALAAWLRLRASCVKPRAVHSIKGKPETDVQVFRLLGAGPNEEPIIAKRCRKNLAMFEAAIYAQVLSTLPISSLQMYGVVEESDTSAWLFLEDAGEALYRRGQLSHRWLASQWLATLHSA